MLHEELAVEAIRLGKRLDDADLIEAGQELQELIDNEEESAEKAEEVREMIRSQV